MQHLLIVDDEKNIRLGLRAMIERQFVGRYTYSFAEHGGEALELLAREPADIMITDIRMPVMDGISLLERIDELPSKPAVVILSGHDDFPYARAAIRYQAREYLLKPIVREELFGVLQRLELETQNLRQQEEVQSSTAAKQRGDAAEQLAYVLHQERFNPAETSIRLMAAELGWLEEGYSIALFQSESGSTGESGSFSLALRLEELLQQETRNWILCRDREGLLVLAAEEGIQLSDLLERLAGHALLPVRLAAGSPARGIGQLRRAYSQARQTLKYFLLYPETELLWYESLGGRSADCPIPTEAVRRLSNLMGTGRLAEMKRLLQQILDIRTVSRCEIGYLEGISRCLNEEVFDRVFRCYGEESIEIFRLYRRAGHIENFQRFQDYYRHVEQLLERLDEFVSRVRSAFAERKDMQRAVDYLQEHYMSDVNMAVVSNYISLSYTYFSQAFKEYTGDSFSAYLRKLRLAKAKELLAASELKVYEISSMSGFDNVKHFTRIFKEAEGITPLEYRGHRQQQQSGKL